MNSCLQITGKSLRPHQREPAVFLRNPRNRGLILFHSTGSGKTLAAIAAVKCFLQDNPTQKAFITAPTSVKSQFEKECTEAGLDMERVFVYPHVTLVNRIKERKVDLTGSMVVIDEAHALVANLPYKPQQMQVAKEPRSVTVFKACKTASKILLMTATPATNVARQLYSYLSVIQGNIRVPKTNVNQIHNDVKCYVSFYTTPANDRDFPSKRVHVKRFTMDREFLLDYNGIETAVEDKLISKGINPDKNPNAFLHEIRKASNKLPGHRNPKVEWLVKKIQQTPSRKRVIYSSFRSSGTHYVQSFLTLHGIPFIEITGDTSKKRRLEAKTKFNEGSSPILFITSAGSEGLDLKGCREVFVLEPHWSHARHKQVIGRAVRYRSHIDLPPAQRMVDVYYLVLSKPDNLNLNNNNYSNLQVVGTDNLAHFLSADDRIMILAYQKGTKINSLYDLLKSEDFSSTRCR